MANKTVKTRIQIKRGTAAEWDTASKAVTPFKPLNGELIYYTDSKVLKIGDGTKTPNQLPVFVDGVTTDDLENIPYATSYEGTAGGVAVGAVTLYSETTDDDGNAVVGDPASAGSSQTPVYFNNGKPTACSTLPYAAANTPGGAANKATALDLSEDVGSDTNPVYFHDGIPVETNLPWAEGETSGCRPAKYANKIIKGTSANSDHAVGNSKVPIYIASDGTPTPVEGIALDLDKNAETATRLKDKTTINLTGAVTATGISFDGDKSRTGGSQNINVTDIKEAYLVWGGKGIAGAVSPIDTATSNVHSANRFAFANPAGISISYSQAGGDFYDYGVTAADKTKLVSGLGAYLYAGNRSKNNAVNDMLRIELNSKTMKVYTKLQKLLINVSKNKSTATVNIQKVAFNGTVSDAGTYEIAGCTGWNSIPTGTTYFGYNSSAGNIEKLILTFTITSIDSASTTDNYCGILDIVAIGETFWETPSNMAKTGHLYSYDENQKAIFPGKVKSTSGFEGTADVATKLGTTTVGNSAEPIYLNAGVPTKGKRIPSILTGTSAPTSSQGENGDIYLMPYASNLPAIYSGTAAPQATLGVDGDIYILYE